MQATDHLCEALYGEIPAAIRSLIDAAATAFDADRDASRRYLLRASELLRVSGSPRAGAEGARQLDSSGGLLAWQLNRIVDYVETHLADKITVMSLASLINVSIGQLFRAFKTSVGVTPWQYISKRRIELACTMMKTRQAALSEIALACGLCDQAHLCKLFRRIVGMSPSAWRRMMPDPDTKPIRAYPLSITHSIRTAADICATGQEFGSDCAEGDSGSRCVSSCHVSAARERNLCMKKLQVRTSPIQPCDLGSKCLLYPGCRSASPYCESIALETRGVTRVDKPTSVTH